MQKFFHITHRSIKSSARTAKLLTAHGRISTPFFMPIATRGAVKTMTTDDLKGLGSQIILANTYHLWQRPGLSVIRKAGGLHRFMGWSGPILTDSGGYQVFSLAQRRRLMEKGVEFISEVDGQKHLLTPEKAIDIQRALGADIVMSLDECPPYPSTRKYAQESLALTTRWAARGLKRFRHGKSGQLLFGIVQGSVYKDLRRQSADELVELGFDGYALGGLAVGEPPEKMYQAIEWVGPRLPENKPRYLMGVGKPDQIVEAVKRGIDMFDCVLPTRNARHGMLFKFKNKSPNIKNNLFYEEIRIKKAQYASDLKPLDAGCDCYTCKNHSRAYLRHLFMCGDPLAWRLATLHNLRFYLHLMELIRENIDHGKL